MKDEKFVESIVREARNILRQKLEDYGGIPSIQIPYSKGEYNRIIELFSSLQEVAYSNHLNVETVDSKKKHLRWSYRFEDAIFVSSEY